MYLKPGDLNYSEETCQRKSWNTSLQHQFILQDRSHPPVSFKQISFQKANAITLSLDTSHLYCFQEKNIFKKVITKQLMLLKLTALLPRRRSFGQQEFSLALLFFFPIIRTESKLSQTNLFFLPCLFQAQREFQASRSSVEKSGISKEEINVFSPHQQFGEGNLNHIPKHLFTLYIVFVKWPKDLKGYRERTTFRSLQKMSY